MNSTQFTPIVIPMEDPIIHTDLHPFCSVADCPCHDITADDRYYEHIAAPLRDGLLTADEANRIYFDEQLVRDQLAYEDEARREWHFNVPMDGEA